MRASGGARAQRIFVVLGSHRSGTSVITRVLALLGLDLGEEDQLLGPIEHDNETGFYEHEAMMLVSDELLMRKGGAWYDPPVLPPGWEFDAALDDLRERGRGLVARDFGALPRWGFKDPRLSLTLPFWRTVLTPSGHVIAHRAPLDVARSLERRNGLPLQHGVALSTYYTALAIVNTIGEPRIFAGYDELFTSRREVVSALAAFLNSDDPAGGPPPWAAIDDAVDPRLRHHAGSPDELNEHPAMSTDARELCQLLERGGGGEALDALAQRLVEPGPPKAAASSARAPAGPSSGPRAAGPRFGPRRLRVVAMMQVYNERRFLAGCLEHLREQGIEVYLIDNESTDETVAIAERYLDQGVIGIETLPREDCFALRAQCKRQEELALTLDADWLIHHDADEIRVSPQRGQTVAQAITEFDAEGFNAVNFLEFAFVPTREFPDHDHPRFADTMRWYYPFLPRFPHRCNAWKRQDEPVDLATEAGHIVSFPGLRMAPRSLSMRHYLFISRRHAREKFVERRFADDEVADGWFGWRAELNADTIALPSVSELRPYISDHLLDPSEPLEHHLLDEAGAPLAASSRS